MNDSTELGGELNLPPGLEAETNLACAGAGRKAAARVPADLGSLSPDVARQLVADLLAHQNEIEIQNEELRRAQNELEESRSRYFALYDLAPVGYLTLAEAGRILEANLTASVLLGLPKSALVKQPLTDFIVPDDQDIYFRHRKDLLAIDAADVRVQGCELRLRRSDGGTFWARIEEKCAFDDATGAHLCRVMVSDITERKRAQETLRVSETRHRILFQKSPDALMTLAPPSWKFTSGNSTAFAMFGAEDESDFILRAPWEYSPERQPDGRSSAEKAAEMIASAMTDGSCSFAWMHQRVSGARFQATVLLTRMEVDGQPLLQAMVRDETEAQRRLAVLGQTDRLASMGLLAAGVAHEINNPLAYVLFNVDTLAQDLPKIADAAGRCRAALRDRVSDVEFTTLVGENAGLLEPPALVDATERAREALAGTNRIKNISKVLGTFSRSEEIERRSVDVGYAMECALTMASNEIRYKAKLVKELGTVPPVWASEGKLSQVFLNLLINASHAIGDGNIEKDIITVRTWTEGGDVFTEVKDTGKGISHQHLGHIFDPFFTTKPVGVGSGLGLSICKNIVDDLGGDIRVESELGEGTRFIVRLPGHTDASGVAFGKTSTVPPPEIDAARGRILIIDDEEPIRTMMKRLLGRDHDLVTATSGEKARALLEKDRDFDLILCDVMMPEMNGLELHTWLMKHAPDVGEKMVFMSGGAFTPKAGEYLGGIANLKIEKPFDALKLKRLVAKRIAAAKK